MRISSMRYLRVGIAIGIALFLAGSTPARALGTYDLATDWSDIINPNGVWTYGVLDSTFVLTPFPVQTASYNSGDFTGQPAWFNGSGPEGLAKRSGSTALDLPVGRVGGHTPVDGSTYLAARWTAPTAMTVDVLGGSWMLRDIGRIDTVSLFVNSVPTFGDVTIPSQPSGTNSGNTFTLAQAAIAGGSSTGALQQIAVVPGDTITLAFRLQTVQDYVGMDFQVQEVTPNETPEPGCVALLVGLMTSGGILVHRRRR